MITLVTPSRGRPQRFMQMWQSAITTATGPIECVLYLDDDDPMRESYPTFGTQVVGDRCVLSEAWNRAAERASGDLLMLCADDLMFRTTGWDRFIADAASAYDDGIVLVHTNDLFQGENLATHPVVSRAWVEAAGYFCPPYFTADFNDVWLHEVADMVGRRVWLPHVIIEHIHPVAGKTPWDQTYNEQRERKVADSMETVYERLRDERERWAERLREAMAG